MKPWSGRFTDDTDPDLEAFSSSLAADVHLLKHDILGSLAHVRALADAGLVTDDEAAALAGGLRDVYDDLVSGDAELDPGLEDIHMNVEALLGDRVGKVADKLHTGRSRNDQVALDMRLWTREAAADLAWALADLADLVLDRAGDHVETPMAARTHLQPAQPTTLGHHLHAYAVRFLRDVRTAVQAAKACEVSPLGAGAVAGSTLPLDPRVAAEALELRATFDNATDAVQDRDFALDATYAATRSAVHLSGLAGELVRWSDPALGYVTLPEAYTTGSSLMPQKQNPDAAELVRATASDVVGDLTVLSTLLGGLPAGYQRDLQQTKPPVFHALGRVPEAARILAGTLEGATFHTERLRGTIRGELFATDLVDHLVDQGVPFRQAHRQVGDLVAEAEDTGVDLADLADKRWPGAAEVFDVDRSLAAKSHGPAPDRLRDAIGRTRSDLEDAAVDLDAVRDRIARAEANLFGAPGPT